MPALPDMTWAALLAKWTVFAKASDHFPRSPAGDRWRAAVPSIITLQAVTLALRDAGSLRPDERALAAAKAAVLIRSSAATLHGLWTGESLPGEVALLISDALAELQAFEAQGLLWTVRERAVDAPDWAGSLAKIEPGSLGLLLLASAGETLLPGTPIAFARARTGGPPAYADVASLARLLEPLADVAPAGPQQVYRQTNPDTGGVSRDMVTPLDAALLPGRPLLLPAVQDGVRQPAHAPARSRRAQLDSVGPWRVVVWKPEPAPE